MVPAGGLLPHLASKRALNIAARHQSPAVRGGRCRHRRLSARRLGVARCPLFLPRALGKYSGQAVANTPLTVAAGGGEEEEEGRETCLSANMEDKGSSGFCPGTYPEAFLWSFN